VFSVGLNKGCLLPTPAAAIVAASQVLVLIFAATFLSRTKSNIILCTDTFH
jgi:hypothetical protein